MSTRLLSNYLKQYCLYWKKLSNDQFGEPVYDNPSEILCRWETMTVQTFDAGGRVLVDSTVVYLGNSLASQGDALLFYPDIDFTNYVTGSLLAKLTSGQERNPFYHGGSEIRKVSLVPNKYGTKNQVACYL